MNPLDVPERSHQLDNRLIENFLYPKNFFYTENAKANQAESNEKVCPFLETYKPTIRTVNEDNVQEITSAPKTKGKLVY